MNVTAQLKASRTKAAWVQEWGTVAVQTGHGDVYKLVIRAPKIARRATAGQFIEVRCVPGRGGSVDPLLRRPFSICEIRPEEGTLSLIYRVVGRGTRALSAVVAGTELDLMGPLGHSFPDPAQGSGTLVLVGGGLGIPPMVAAAEAARAAGRPCVALIGARSTAYLAGAAELKAAGVLVTVMTDDGSAGRPGLVTVPLAELLALRAAGVGGTGNSAAGHAGDHGAGTGAGHARDHGAAAVGEVWACGPEVMLNAVKSLCIPAGVPCFVSVERHMACGFGACIGCTVPKAGQPGYLKTCQDGPVFAAEEVELGEP